MTTNNLRRKAASGIAWTAVQKYSTMTIQFVSGIILARLLSPHDYGCIGMLSIFMVLAEALIDGGFGSALIQKKNPTQEDYSTIFFWNLGMSSLMYAVLFVSAPVIARFFDIPLLCPVLRVQALVLFIYAFNLVQRNQLRKALNFKLLSIITVTTSLISLGVTIILAYKGFGVWALVAQNLITASIPAISFWFYVKWRPMWIFSWKSFKELFGFGFYMFLMHLVNTFSLKLQGLLIGRVYNSTTMGYFSKAMTTESMASESMSSIMNQVTYPLYSQAQDDKGLLANMIKRLTMTISYLTFPLMFILILTAKPIFVLLYSDRWLESVPYFQVLCFAGLAVCLQSVNLQSISAIGKSRITFFWTMIKASVRIVFITAGLWLGGMKGLLVGMVLSSWFYLFVNMSLVSKYIGYKLWEQVKNLAPIVIVSVIIAGICYFVGELLSFNMFIEGIIMAVVYFFLYMLWSILFKPEAFNYTIGFIPKKYKFWENCR